MGNQERLSAVYTIAAATGLAEIVLATWQLAEINECSSNNEVSASDLSTTAQASTQTCCSGLCIAVFAVLIATLISAVLLIGTTALAAVAHSKRSIVGQLPWTVNLGCLILLELLFCLFVWIETNRRSNWILVSIFQVAIALISVLAMVVVWLLLLRSIRLNKVRSTAAPTTAHTTEVESTAATSETKPTTDGNTKEQYRPTDKASVTRGAKDSGLPTSDIAVATDLTPNSNVPKGNTNALLKQEKRSETKVKSTSNSGALEEQSRVIVFGDEGAKVIKAVTIAGDTSNIGVLRLDSSEKQLRERRPLTKSLRPPINTTQTNQIVAKMVAKVESSYNDAAQSRSGKKNTDRASVEKNGGAKTEKTVSFDSPAGTVGSLDAAGSLKVKTTEEYKYDDENDVITVVYEEREEIFV